MIIWTLGYRPFIMGGNVNAPVGVEVEVTEPIELPEGPLVYEVALSDGRTAIAEATTGAIIGSSLAIVKRDVRQGDPEVMISQIELAADMMHDVELVPMERFLSMWRG